MKDLSPNDLADIFGQTQTESSQRTASFGGGLDPTADIFVDADPGKNQDILNPPTTDTPATGDKDKPEVTVEEPKDDADIFGDDAKTPTEGDKPLEIKSLSDYYTERVKTGLFMEMNDEDEKGNKVPFVPKTPEEFDEVIEMQVNYKLSEAKRELEEKWYEGKTPAWQAIAQYAEMVDNPAELIPFLQGVKNVQTVSNLDENDPEQAEQIIRARMEQRGEPDEFIKTQIESLKTTDNLLSTAKQVKPLMVKQEQQMLSQQYQEAKQREQQYLQVVNDIRENAHKAIEQPIFGKQKLKQDEKALIYDMIAVPSEETQGYGIYSMIDKLFDNKDFETLKLMALLGGKKEAFFQYMGTDIANQTSAKLQRKLTMAGDKRTSSGHDIDISERPVIQRGQFNKQPRFGK